MKRKATILCFLFAAAGCTGAATEELTAADITEEELLYYETFGDADKSHSTMVIYLSGDTGARSGVDSRYLFSEAERTAAEHDVIAVALLRPGTRDKHGNRSIGYQPGSDDNKTPSNNALVAKTIFHLKEKYGAENVVAIGHSGGGMMLGTLIGRYPKLIDAVILAASVCHVSEYRIGRGRSLWPKSQSPHHFAEHIPKSTTIRLVTGERDKNTYPKYAKKCEALYQGHGLDADATIVDGATHRYSTISDTVSRKLQSLLQ